jgi:hypothetical protein
MGFFVVGLISVAGVFLAYQTIRPMTRRKRKFDAGSVSEYWLQQQRGESDSPWR